MSSSHRHKMPMQKSARLFHCIRCQLQVVICRFCDRGNIYCGSICSQQARAQYHRLANQRYQKSLKGRQQHAERQRRYRQRQKEKVTDKGSTHLPPNDLLPGEPNENRSWQSEPIFCHFCGEMVSTFLRHGYLRHPSDTQPRHSSSWPLGP